MFFRKLFPFWKIAFWEILLFGSEKLCEDIHYVHYA